MADLLRQQVLDLLAVEPQTEAIGRQVAFLKEELFKVQEQAGAIDPVANFQQLLGGRTLESRTLVSLFKDDTLIARLRAGQVKKSEAASQFRKLQMIVTTNKAQEFQLTEKYLFDGVIGTPSSQLSTALQFVLEGSRLRCAKSGSKKDMWREENALECVHKSNATCPTIVPLLDSMNSSHDRRTLIFPYYGLAVSQLMSSCVSEMVVLHANVAMCGLATIMACNSAGLCHGDIKPANMMLSDSGVIVTIDFGSATTFNSFAPSSTPMYGMDVPSATLEYDLACLASSLLVLADESVADLTVAATKEKFGKSSDLAQQLAVRLVSSSDLNGLWSEMSELIAEHCKGRILLLDFATIKPTLSTAK